MATASEDESEVIHWPDEATAVINDVKIHVKSISISTKLPSTDLEIYLNCETLEEKKYTIRLSGDGFQLVADAFDKIDNFNRYPYETPYALLNEISPGYTASFGNELTKALLRLQADKDSESD